MSGPSATEKPISAKIAVISSITWLIGWMRPRISGASWHRQRHVDALGASRASRAAAASVSFLAAIAPCTASRRPLISGPRSLRSSGRHRAEGLQQLGDGALLAERGDAHGFQGRFVAGGIDLGEQVTFELVEIGHRSLARFKRFE